MATASLGCSRREASAGTAWPVVVVVSAGADMVGERMMGQELHHARLDGMEMNLSETKSFARG